MPLFAAQKKHAARMARVTRRSSAAAAMDMASLRRSDPHASTAVGRFLAQYASIAQLRGRLEMAGMRIAPQRLFLIAGGLVLLCILLALMFGMRMVFALPLALLAGLMLPHLYIRRRLKKRQLQFLKLFPEAIDLTVRGLRAGLPVGESFHTVSREIPPPVGDIFAMIGQQTALGLPMEKALSEAAMRIELTEFNFFVTTIILQRETGGNLGEILGNLSETLRARQMMKLKIHALSSEARASAYIVGSLPFVVWALLSMVSPQYLLPLYNDVRGNISLGVAGGMMGFGAFVMKKMTQMEI